MGLSYDALVCVVPAGFRRRLVRIRYQQRPGFVGRVARHDSGVDYGRDPAIRWRLVSHTSLADHMLNMKASTKVGGESREKLFLPMGLRPDLLGAGELPDIQTWKGRRGEPVAAET